MTLEAWFTLAVVAATVAVLVTERISAPYAVFGATVVLLVAGVVTPEQALSGFSNPAPFAVAALYVLAGAAEITGALEPVVESALGRGGDDRRPGLGRLLVPAAAASAFLNNTPIVAMIAPRIASWARRQGASPSPYLMPLSFAVILGGLSTVIGTSTNVVVSGLLTKDGRPPLGFFEISRVGVPVAIVGLLVLVTLSRRLLPARRAVSEDVTDPREFTVELVVGDAIAGRTVAEAGLRSLEGVYLAAIERDGRVLAPVGPHEVLVEGDRLTFAGNVDRVLDLQEMPGLSSAEEPHFAWMGEAPGRRFFEVVVAPGSALAGSTLKDVGFRARYGAAVMAIHRAGERVPGKLGSVALRAGDVLLVLADVAFARRAHDHRDFLVVAPLSGRLPLRPGKAGIVGLVGVGIVALVATGILGLLEATLVGAVALVLTRVLTPSEARDAVDVGVIVLIAASFGVGEAVLRSGLASEVAGIVVDGFSRFGDVGILAGVIVATIVLTELITNNAAAILMFPIATATATAAGLEPRAFAIAVAVGASASFLTPIGYQTNTMVYGLGGYRFGDFARLGAPLTVLMVAASLVLIPLGWPLRG